MIKYLDHLKVPSLKNIGSKQELFTQIRKNPLKNASLQLVARKFHFSNKQAAAIGGVALRTFQRQSPNTTLSVSASESVVKLAEVYETGLMAFDYDEEAFLEWLRTPIPALDNQIPETMLTSSMGADLVNQELLRIEYGNFS